MITVIQRVTEASVTIEGVQTAKISSGLVALVGVEKLDDVKISSQLAERLVSYRVFADQHGKMNLDLRAHGGQILLVPQFTLVASTSKGRRPGFSAAAPPEQASRLFDELVSHVARQLGQSQPAFVQQGTFGADMKIHLVNDGPVTFLIRVDSQE